MFEKSTTNYERKTTFCGSMTYFLRDERLPTAKEKQPLTSEKLLFTSVAQTRPMFAREKPLEKLPGS